MYGFFYRLLMKVAHRFNWHYAPPVYPNGDTQLWCKWCGLSQTIHKRNPLDKGPTGCDKNLLFNFSQIHLDPLNHFADINHQPPLFLLRRSGWWGVPVFMPFVAIHQPLFHLVRFVIYHLPMINPQYPNPSLTCFLWHQ